MTGKEEERPITIPELLDALRRDLDTAQANLARLGKAPLLRVDGAEIEIQLTASRSTEGEGGLNLSVLGVGLKGGGKKAKEVEQGHKLTLTLKPIGRDPIGAAD